MRDDISLSEYRSVVGRELWDEAHQDLKFYHGLRCDDLSRRIAVETGQAKEIAPGVIQLKQAHIYYVGGDRHAAIVGDRWNPEICR